MDGYPNNILRLTLGLVFLQICDHGGAPLHDVPAFEVPVAVVEMVDAFSAGIVLGHLDHEILYLQRYLHKKYI